MHTIMHYKFKRNIARYGPINVLSLKIRGGSEVLQRARSLTTEVRTTTDI